MLLPSFLIGLLPTYLKLGSSMTILLVLLRLMQGFAVGGEMIGAYIFTIESSKGENRGFWGAMCKASGSLGVSLGTGMVVLLRTNLTHEQLYSFGWRIPFLTGVIIGSFGIWLRSNLPNEYDQENHSLLEQDNKKPNELNNNTVISPLSQYEDQNHNTNQLINNEPPPSPLSPLADQNPIKMAWEIHWKEIILVGIIVSFWPIGYYSSFVWMQYFMSEKYFIGGDGIVNSWEINFYFSLILTLIFPLGGLFGDYIGMKIGNEDEGYRKVLQLGLIIMIIFCIPAYALISTRTYSGAIVGNLIFLISLTIFGSNLPGLYI
jgi:MHS family proline/betaine transporter-like MFS transporter